MEGNIRLRYADMQLGKGRTLRSVGCMDGKQAV